jgi:gamma-polyglutamate synthase
VNGLWPAAALLLAFLALLLAERLSLDAARRRVAVCVAVTGTRGKSSVTRLIAAALRADGRTVLVKTTGSRPAFSESAGEERLVPRTGPPTILEQKRVLRAAARTGTGVLVAEMMSIRPECLRAEAGRILKPDLLVITNARVDHREEMGPTADAAAAALAEAITPGCTVLVPAAEDHPAFRDAARRRGARLVLVAGPAAAEEAAGGEAGTELEFPENRRLAAAAASVLGVSAARISAGLLAAVPDFGALRVWRLKPSEAAGPRFAVSAFAANEPASTRLVLARLAAIRPGLPERRIGILALREDRPDRTRQWLEAAARGFFSGFSGLVVVGPAARPAARRLRRLLRPGTPVVTAGGAAPEAIRAAAEAGAGPQAAVFIGLGNIAGAGAALVELWDREGEAA